MNHSAPAFYELGSLGECEHSRARLTCDFPVSGLPSWYVTCAACGAAGPTAPVDQEAIDGWRELVEFVEALGVWNERTLETVPLDRQSAGREAAGPSCGPPATRPELAPLEVGL